MNKTYSKQIDEKIVELKSQIATMKVNETVSKNTRNTQLSKMRREKKVLTLINNLIKNSTTQIEFNEDDLDTFVSITTLSSERIERTVIVVNEGDSILELMQKYADKKDLQRKLTEECNKKNLKLDYANNKIVKA